MLAKFYQFTLNAGSARGKIFDDIFGQVNSIKVYFLYFGCIVVTKFFFNYYQTLFAGITAERFTKLIREKLFRKQLATQLSEFEKKAPGNYLLRYSGDLGALNNFITKGIIGFINDVLFIILTLAIFFLISKQLSIIILASFPVIFFIVFILNLKLKLFTSKRRDIRSQNLAFISSRLTALLTIKVFNREPLEAQKFEKRSTKLYESGLSYYKWYALINSLLPFLLYTMLGVILFVAYDLTKASVNKLSGADILLFILLTVSIIPVFRRILKVNIVWQTGNISFKKLLVLLNASEELTIKEQLVKFNSGSIVFEKLSFKFNDGKHVFQDFTAHIPGYGIYSLEGQQGSGKSSLFKIILGLYEPDKGSIIIDSKNITELSKRTLRKNSTMVSIELPLIGNNIFESVSYSRKEEKKPEVNKMLNSLGFHTEGGAILEHPITEGGRNISTGQRKLLLIARALLTNKKIILLDEPFTGLDEVYKDKVIHQLNILSKKRTIIIIDKEKNDSLAYSGVIRLPDLKR